MLASARALFAVLALPACTTIIHPPPAPHMPSTIAVLDHGRHASLLVEVPGAASVVRYSYGDWGWYALRRTGAVEATDAILLPSQGALGRRELPGPLSAESIARHVRVGIEEAIVLQVEAQAARALIARLDGLYADNLASRIYNESYDLEFVHHPDDYWALRNSNQMVAAWLVILGCEIDGPALLSDWRLGPPRAP